MQPSPKDYLAQDLAAVRLPGDYGSTEKLSRDEIAAIAQHLSALGWTKRPQKAQTP